MPPAPRLSVVVACYNEEEVLETSVAEIVEVLQDFGRPFEIVFVDDVSRDRTREILREIVAAYPSVAIQLILHDTNRGRGATVTDGFRAARGEIVGYLDMIEVTPHPCSCGDREGRMWHGRRIYATSSARWTLRMTAAIQLAGKLLGTALNDTEIGYKFFRSRPSWRPRRIRPGWFWDTEFMIGRTTRPARGQASGATCVRQTSTGAACATRSAISGSSSVPARAPEICTLKAPGRSA